MTVNKKIEFLNKKARFEYEILESLEVGVVLTSHEIKAIRDGRVNMTGSYAKIMNGEIFWLGGEINVLEGDRQRTRKLLLHKAQIERLAGKTLEKGFALLPLKLYIVRGRVKMELGLGRGLKKYDKRSKIKEREQHLEAERKIKQY